ncbi:unnamed protein product, partial [Meganyctiphanes norvegica]
MYINIHKDHSLKNYNTFKVDVKAKYFGQFSSELHLRTLLNNNVFKNENILVLGEGSNILFTHDYEGLLLVNCIKGIHITKEDVDSVYVDVGSGEIWQDFVQWSIDRNLSGVENLVLIPGTVGASPVQNIGAYGCEVKEVITHLQYVDIDTGEKLILNNVDCEFSYRNSIFKHKLKGKVIITKVSFKLSKKANNIITYGTIKQELDVLFGKELYSGDILPTLIARAITNIRTRKLPNPKIVGNGGSFFKNVCIPTYQFNDLMLKYPQIVGYTVNENITKVSTGSLIEQAGWKGYRKGDAGVWPDNCMVMVNFGNATGKEIFQLAQDIKASVME